MDKSKRFETTAIHNKARAVGRFILLYFNREYFYGVDQDCSNSSASETELL